MEHVIDDNLRIYWSRMLDNLISDNSDELSDRELVEKAAAIASQVLGDKDNFSNEIKKGDGYVLVRGCPIENVLDAKRRKGLRTHSKLSLLGLTHWLGFRPFSYMQEKSGMVVHEIIPIKENKDSVSSNGYVEFRPHADGAYLPRDVRPETLSLICLNNDSMTDTKLVSIDSIVSEMSEKDIRALMMPNFVHIPPETFNVTPCKHAKTSVLDCVDGVWEVKVALHNSQALNSSAEWALKRFADLALNKGVSVSWRPGDILVFSNYRCLHGRGSISGSRWLRRCYGSERFEPCTVVDLAS